MPTVIDPFEAAARIRLDGRVVWVTGASRGLGRALALGFAGAGARVLATARSADALDETVAAIRERGGEALAVPGSVTDPGDVEAALEAAREAWGRLDALVNNAGVSPHFKRSEQLADDELRSVLETNLIGPLACTRSAFELLEADGGGAVVNVSSIHGARAHERMLAYAAAKGGLELVTRTLAVEWAARGVRVNSLAPGYLETDMTTGLREHPRWRESLLSRIPMGRFGKPEEIVPAALFLASPASSYVTGATLFADGGWTAG